MDDQISVDLQFYKVGNKLMVENGIITEAEQKLNDEHIDMIQSAINDEDGDSMGELLSYMRQIHNVRGSVQ